MVPFHLFLPSAVTELFVQSVGIAARYTIPTKKIKISMQLPL